MAIPLNFPYKHSGHVELFDFFESASVNAGANKDLINIQVPTTIKRGFVTYFGHGIDDLTQFKNTVWSLKIGNVLVRAYSKIQDQLGPFSQPQEIIPSVIKPGDFLAVNVLNNGGSAFLFAARLKGFFDFQIGED